MQTAGLVAEGPVLWHAGQATAWGTGTSQGGQFESWMLHFQTKALLMHFRKAVWDGPRVWVLSPMSETPDAVSGA